MPASKAYSRVDWKDYPNKSTKIMADNLNRMDEGIDNLDDRVVSALNSLDTVSGKQLTDEANILALQGSVAALNGFTFYPAGEVNLVAFVADDSFYKDADDKYVLANSTTGQALIDGVTYKALASTEDTRGEVGADTCSPFKGKINTYGYGGTHASVNHLYEYEGIDFDVLYVHSCDANSSTQSQRVKTWRRGENPTFTLEYYNFTTNKYGTWTINVVSKNKFTYSLSTTDTTYVQSYGAHFDFSVAGY